MKVIYKETESYRGTGVKLDLLGFKPRGAEEWSHRTIAKNTKQDRAVGPDPINQYFSYGVTISSWGFSASAFALAIAFWKASSKDIAAECTLGPANPNLGF